MNNSAKRVLEILELFAQSPVSMTVSEVASTLGYPKTSVFDIISILHERGFIRQDNARAKTYVIGVKAYQVGMSYLRHADLYSIVHPILADIRDRLGETCYFAIEEKGQIIYIDKLESSAPIRSSCNVGSNNLMHLTGLGKAILAAWPDEKVRGMFTGALEVHTAATIADVDSLIEELHKTRIRGYALDLGEDNPYIRCTAAPIYDSRSNVAGAVSISMLDNRFTPAMQERAGEEITKAALCISQQLGYREKRLYHQL